MSLQDILNWLNGTKPAALPLEQERRPFNKEGSVTMLSRSLMIPDADGNPTLNVNVQLMYDVL